MDSKLNPLRVILLALLTCLILFLIGAGVLYLRDSYVMREGDIAYNSGDYLSALSRYRVLQKVFPFKQEAFQKADYCFYNLGREAMEREDWEEAVEYLSQVKSFELDSVNRLIAECRDGIRAREDRARSEDQNFLEDLEKAITLRMDPDDSGDVLSRELMFLKKYEDAYFQDQNLKDAAGRYLAALRAEQRAGDLVYESERQVARDDGRLRTYAVLNDLYEEYGFMADDVRFVGEFVGNFDRVRAYNTALHEVYRDMHSQVDRNAAWPATSDYSFTYYHVFRNNTPHYVSLEFHYYIYTANNDQYLGGSAFPITDVPPETDYKVRMTETDNQNGVSFLVDWTVTDIK